jgi:hypothetical protein
MLTMLLVQVNAAIDPDDANGTADVTLLLTARSVFAQAGAAVHYCMQQTHDLNQRRQLLRHWTEAVATLMQYAGA